MFLVFEIQCLHSIMIKPHLTSLFQEKKKSKYAKQR
jgi:hypothetical protein